MGWHLNTFIIPHISLNNHNMLISHSDMAAQTYSPFETLARVIEHLDADDRSVRRTEAAGSGDGEPLRATLEVSVAGVVGSGLSGVDPVDASIGDGLSVTYRIPSFPDPAESLPPEHPPVSLTATGVETDGEDMVVTLGVAIDTDGDSGGNADGRTDESATLTVRDATSTDGAATFGRGRSKPELGGDAIADGELGRGDESAKTSDDSGSLTADVRGDESPLSAVRDESVPPYDDTRYLQRLYETCGTFAEMSDRIEMDVSAETVRRYMIEAGVHSPTSYETDDERREDSDEGTAGASKSGASGGDSSETTVTEASDSGRSETAVERSSAAVSTSGGDGEPDAEGETQGDASLTDEQLVADGIGLPEELTLHEVVDAVVDARTVHEVQREIGVSYERTRQLLTQLNVLDLVVGRVGSEPNRDSTVEAVTERIRQRAPDTA